MLALREFFWNPADWVAPPPIVLPDLPAESWGSKSKQFSKPKPDNGLEGRTSHDQEYWDLRERYLRRFMEPVLQTSKVEEDATLTEMRESGPIKAHEDKVREGQSHLELLVQARDTVAQRARIAATQNELRREVARVIKLTLDISSLRNQYYERAAIILLLDLF